MPMLIPLPLTVPETGEILCPALLADGAHLVLVDCGYPDSLPLIEDAMAGLGLSPGRGSPCGCARPRRCSRPCPRRPGPGARPSAGG